MEFFKAVIIGVPISLVLWGMIGLLFALLS
jgi:hypothetical protein